MEQESFSLEALVFLLNLAVYVLASHLIERWRIAFLHESAIAVCLGLLTALLIKCFLGKEIAFRDEYFFALLLPPIVFSVGYAIKKPFFFQNIALITFLGVATTVLTVCLFALMLIAVNSAFLGFLSSKDILMMAAVLASIDPIAAVPLIKDSHGRLAAVVSGEGVINSAVVIILFGTIAGIDEFSQEYSVDFVLQILLNFAYLFFFSLLLGVVFGLLLSLVFKRIESFSRQPIKQSSLILLTGYAVYLIGEFLGLSGIIALFTCAIIFSMYGFQNLSTEAKHGTILAFETVRYVAQAFIFAYLGASLLTIQTHAAAIGLALLLILSIPLVRFLSIAILPLIYRIGQRTFPLGSGERKMLWYCGLMRGVIAFALSLQIESENKSFMVTLSLLVVMSTTISGATLLRTFASRIGLTEIGIIRFGEVKEQERQIELMPATKYGVIGEQDEGRTGRQEDQGAQEEQQGERFKTFQEKFIKPLFTKPSSGKAEIFNAKVHIQT